ncbi:MAG: hypothetical protein ABFE08_00770 [Armatimonadia bacterium]
MAHGLSPDVVEQTRRFWEERTGKHVSEEDAREAIRNMSAFCDLLASWEKPTTATPTEATPEEAK